MDFSLSEERKMLQETVARFFENNYKDIKKRGEYLDMNDGFSREFWKESSNLGVISGLISPTFGGQIVWFSEVLEVSESSERLVGTISTKFRPNPSPWQRVMTTKFKNGTSIKSTRIEF